MGGQTAAHTSKNKNTGRTEERSQASARQVAGSSPHADVLDLQHAAGNRAVSEVLQSSHTAPRGHDVPPIVRSVLNSSGQPLDPATRAFMEPRFGHDFGGVRVHTDAKAAESARAVDARAYTVGRDVVFSEGGYTPHLRQGSKLLAHELAHVIQQERGGPSPPLRGGVLERDADAAASALVAGRGPIHVERASAPGLARQPVAGEKKGGIEIATSSMDYSNVTLEEMSRGRGTFEGVFGCRAFRRFIIEGRELSKSEASKKMVGEIVRQTELPYFYAPSKRFVVMATLYVFDTGIQFRDELWQILPDDPRDAELALAGIRGLEAAPYEGLGGRLGGRLPQPKVQPKVSRPQAPAKTEGPPKPTTPPTTTTTTPPTTTAPSVTPPTATPKVTSKGGQTGETPTVRPSGSQPKYRRPPSPKYIGRGPGGPPAPKVFRRGQLTAVPQKKKRIRGRGAPPARQPQQGIKLTDSGTKRIGDLRDLKDTKVRDAITSRGGGGQEVTKVHKDMRDKTVGEVANIAGPSRPPTEAAAKDLWEKANDAIKIVKQAKRLGGKKHGE